MFIEEEDWSDGQEAEVPSKTVLKTTKQTNSSNNVKRKAVGKKSLMHTLQTLGSVPDWKSSDHEQDSDSETGEAPSHPKKKKKKKKSRKRRKQTGDDQQENGDLDKTVEEETPTKKKKKDNKPAALKVKTTSVAETNTNKETQSVKANVNKPGDADKLSRQQWKNKMKNKRKCKNKYKPEEKEVNKMESAEKHEPKKDVKTDSSSNKNENKNSHEKPDKEKGKVKPQKRKKVKEDTEESHATETLVEEKEKETKISTKSSAGEHKAEITEDPVPTKRVKPEQSKEQILKRQRLRKMLEEKSNLTLSPAEDKDEPAAAPGEEEEEEKEEEVKLDRSSSLRSRMEQRLESARFRYINELLYSTTSGEARRMFKQDPQAFGIYHRGYTAQVQRWPANPVDAIISYIQHKTASLVVADFGCGDCKIARSVKNKVHSFDLAATCDLVTVCDMANVPLKDASVDIAVFCLSLMGTNLGDFLAEANRVLKMGGVLKIAEVASRFENTRNFLTGLANLGFKMVSKDTENTHFYSFELTKIGNAPENVKKFGLQLRACVYKKR